MGTHLNHLTEAVLTEAVLTCTHNLCFEQTYEEKKSNFFLVKFSIFTTEKNLFILHGHVFIMCRSWVFNPGSA